MQKRREELQKEADERKKERAAEREAEKAAAESDEEVEEEEEEEEEDEDIEAILAEEFEVNDEEHYFVELEIYMFEEDPIKQYNKNRRIGHLYKSSTFVRAPVQTFPTAFPIKCLFIRAPPRYNRHRPAFSFPKRQLFFIRRPHYYQIKSPIIHNDP